ncbi:response regulator transcription factor [Reinekea sp.]|jgi:two-component system OmpR family response regulator|uniref:response regulator transcription factor n=1 Tax=Reinekea sp. TaxID=1970455 RepID=UPI003988F4A4
MTAPEFEYARIILVEDDLALAELTATYLESHGYLVDIITDGIAAAETIPEKAPDLVILDIMIPGLDGLGVCRQIRPRYDGPIIFLTARGDSIDEILGLELGADDYLAKPVEPRRLLARIRASLRRTIQPATNTTPSRPSAFSFDLASFEVRYNGSVLPLSQPEFKLLHCLFKQSGEIVSRDDIMKSIRGIEYDGLSRTADILVSELRKKLPPGEWIKTIRGQGYIWLNSE